jgi:potassium-transporting ATPase KdpC subunit
MRRYCKPACIVLALGIVLFGVMYPIGMWCIAHLLFPWQAEGSVFTCKGNVIGFSNIGQPFSRPEYFWPRPVAKGISPLASGGSNLSWSQPGLKALIQTRAAYLKQNNIREPIPDDLLLASASGLDPDISIQAAFSQARRIAQARNLSEEQVMYLLLDNESSTVFGLFPRRINVLDLNCQLDRHYPMP